MEEFTAAALDSRVLDGVLAEMNNRAPALDDAMYGSSRRPSLTPRSANGAAFSAGAVPPPAPRSRASSRGAVESATCHRGGSRPSSGCRVPGSQATSEATTQASMSGAHGAFGSSAASRTPVSRSARPLLLERSRFPSAGSGVVQWRRPVPAPVSPAGASAGKLPPAPSGGEVQWRQPTPIAPPSPACASAAALAAGAIASGRVPPKMPTTPSSGLLPDVRVAEEQNLVASMASRLARVERLNQQQAMKLAKQTHEVHALKSELDALRRAGKASGDDCDELGILRAEREQLKQQVEDMIKFLGDYGLTWVGSPDGEGEDGEEPASDKLEEPSVSLGAYRGESQPPPTDSGYAEAPSTLRIDIQLMESSVQALNAVVEKDCARIVSSRVGGAIHAKLVQDDASPVPLTFFSDGVKLGSHAFQAYDHASSQLLLRDIKDGYFPYALKDEYPDGVALKVVDRMSHLFSAWLHCHAQEDPELLEDGDRLVPAGSRIVRGQGGAKSVGERFLAKLPERVVRNGQICDVRSAVSKRLGGDAAARVASEPALRASAAASNAAVLEGRDAAGLCRTPDVVSLLDEEVHEENEDKLVRAADAAAPATSSASTGHRREKLFARLQVKLESGQRVMLHMEARHTIGDLEEALDRWRNDHGVARCLPPAGQRHALRTAFPPQSYTDRSRTLEAAGLLPNANLFMGLVEEVL